MLKEVTATARKRITRVRENPILREFREFAMRGSVIDLAIGIMVGGGFNKIVTSLVNDIIMPPIGAVVGRMDFSNLFFVLGNGKARSVAEAKAGGIATINYGLFLNNVIDFLIIAAVTFFVVRQINRWKRKDMPPPSGSKECPYCRMDIPERALRCPQCTSSLVPVMERNEPTFQQSKSQNVPV